MGTSGPQQMLARLESIPLENEVSEKEGVAFYWFATNHVRRAVGTMSTFYIWDFFPFYETEGLHDLARHEESFRAGRPWTFLAYWWLAHSHFLSGYDVDFPLRVKDSGLELTARIIRQSRDQYRKRFGSDEFYVLLSRAEFGREIVPYLQREKIRYLDFMDLDLETLTHHSVAIAGDGHPTAQAHEAFAKALADSLSH